MRVSDSGIDLIRNFEGLRLHSYDDGGGVWTIGYGSTSGVTPGMTIDEAEATRLLKSDLMTAEQCVDEAVEVEVTQNQFDALVSFVFNVGCRAFQNSTLLKLLNGGNAEAAAKQFARWNKDNQKILAGLTKRRASEAELFLT